MTRIAFLTILVLGLVSVQAFSKPKDHAQSFMQELNLTESQRAQVKKIKEKYKDVDSREVHSALRKAKEELVKSLQEPQRGPEFTSQAREKFKDLLERKRKFQEKKFEMALEVRALLTDEQIKKFKALQRHDRDGELDREDEKND